ncbi:hypothetical protein TrCOL_g6942 [Triparma columacea]|uniref:Uncharacterized protein n=1 Tax=Triparma columacea TaxID=722753 RepID=A0A9W7L9U9_9STRA|nr:hypothetical protein TrCOL_g6942 [Triparma columacea]
MKERKSAASNTTDAIPSNLSRTQRKRMRRKANQERREAEAKGILPTIDLSSLNQEAAVTPTPLPPVPTPSTTSSDHVEADSAETPFVAYLSIVNFLNAAASSAGKSKAEIRVYDPYYCDGSVKRHLAKLGYNCYNENEDFYAAIEQGRTPSFDVLVTNPPYSHDHIQRCLQFAASCGKPYALLLPNYVYNKDYYRDSIEETRTRPFYLIPNTRYTYTVPSKFVKGDRLRQGTSPFPTFWYLGGCTGASHSSVLEKVRVGLKEGERVSENVEGLPNDARDITDKEKKRKNPKQRKKEKMRKRGGGGGGGGEGGKEGGGEGRREGGKKKKKRF